MSDARSSGGSRLPWIAPATLLFALAALGYHFWRIEVVVESVPPGAVVRVDGRAAGTTPLTLDLPPGRHRVELAHPQYRPETINLSVARGDRVRHQVLLTRGTGRLSLLSNPRGAWVELDGVRQQGATPTEVEVPTGPVNVRMGLAERRPQQTNVIVLADQTLEVNLELDIDPHGSLTVSVAPADASVRLPELDLGYQPGLRVPIGEQLIEVSRPGFVTQRIRFDVRYGDNRTRVELDRLYGTIRVRTSPVDALVSLSYEAEPGRTVSKPYQPDMQVPAGTVGVSARALGYRTAYRAVTVGSGRVSVDLRLTRMNVTVGETFRDTLAGGGEGPLMVVVPAGRFVMGEPDGAPSVTPATVRTLSQPFAVSVDEVSVADYRKFATSTGAPVDDRLRAPEEPMRYVSWREAVAYADWLSTQTGQRYRLPTEAEWEYVARAGTDNSKGFGDDPAQLCRYANLADQSARRVFRDWTVAACDDGFARLAPVGSLEANPFGIHDLLGNVAEWVLECGMPTYDGAPEDGSLVNSGQSCATHGVRGGAWDSKPEALTASRRGFARTAGDDRGIRLVKEL